MKEYSPDRLNLLWRREKGFFKSQALATVIKRVMDWITLCTGKTNICLSVITNMFMTEIEAILLHWLSAVNIKEGKLLKCKKLNRVRIPTKPLSYKGLIFLESKIPSKILGKILKSISFTNASRCVLQIYSLQRSWSVDVFQNKLYTLFWAIDIPSLKIYFCFIQGFN